MLFHVLRASLRGSFFNPNPTFDPTAFEDYNRDA